MIFQPCVWASISLFTCFLGLSTLIHAFTSFEKTPTAALIKWQVVPSAAVSSAHFTGLPLEPGLQLTNTTPSLNGDKMAAAESSAAALSGQQDDNKFERAIDVEGQQWDTGNVPSSWWSLFANLRGSDDDLYGFDDFASLGDLNHSDDSLWVIPAREVELEPKVDSEVQSADESRPNQLPPGADSAAYALPYSLLVRREASYRTARPSSRRQLEWSSPSMIFKISKALPAVAFQTDWSRWALLRCLAWCFGTLWLLEFVYATMQFTVGYCVAVWYFTVPDVRGRREVPSCLGLALWVALRYHLGTLAIGAFCLVLFNWPQRVLNFIEKRWKFTEASAGKFTRLFSLMLWYSERITRLVNQLGYIECVIEPKGYLSSCQIAYQRLRTELPSLALLQGITSVLSTSAGIIIPITFTMLTYYATSNFATFCDPTSNWYVDSPAALTAVVLTVSAIIMHICVLTLDHIADCILYCFLIEFGDRREVVHAPDEIRSTIEEHEAEFTLDKVLSGGSTGAIGLPPIVASNGGLELGVGSDPLVARTLQAMEMGRV